MGTGGTNLDEQHIGTKPLEEGAAVGSGITRSGAVTCGTAPVECGSAGYVESMPLGSEGPGGGGLVSQTHCYRYLSNINTSVSDRYFGYDSSTPQLADIGGNNLANYGDGVNCENSEVNTNQTAPVNLISNNPDTLSEEIPIPSFDTLHVNFLCFTCFKQVVFPCKSCKIAYCEDCTLSHLHTCNTGSNRNTRAAYEHRPSQYYSSSTSDGHRPSIEEVIDQLQPPIEFATNNNVDELQPQRSFASKKKYYLFKVETLEKCKFHPKYIVRHHACTNRSDRVCSMCHIKVVCCEPLEYFTRLIPIKGVDFYSYMRLVTLVKVVVKNLHRLFCMC